MLKVIDFVFAARPMLLFPLWSIFIISFSIINNGQDIGLSEFILLSGLTLLVSGAYYINQVYDIETDRINNKLSFLQTGKITKREMIAAYLSTSVLGLAVGFYISMSSGMICIVVFVLGYLYSAPPFRLKDRPVLGLLSNAFAYGTIVPMAVPGFWSCAVRTQIYIVGYFTFLVAAAYLLTLIPDREGDIKSGKKTLAVKLSDRMLLFFGMILIARTVFLGNSMDNLYLIIISSTAFFLFLIAFLYKKKGLILFACKLPIFLMTLLAGYYNPVYLIFIIVLLIITRVYYKMRFGIIYPRLT